MKTALLAKLPNENNYKKNDKNSNNGATNNSRLQVQCPETRSILQLCTTFTGAVSGLKHLKANKTKINTKNFKLIKITIDDRLYL